MKMRRRGGIRAGRSDYDWKNVRRSEEEPVKEFLNRESESVNAGDDDVGKVSFAEGGDGGVGEVFREVEHREGLC